MMARDVLRRAEQEIQIWHEICCNSLKRMVQDSWRSVAVHRPHISNCSSSKDTCTMLVSGPSLPVLWYLWSSSRSRKPLPRHWQFHPRKLATNPFPLSTWRYEAVHRNMCTGRWDIWIPPQPPEYASRHPTLGRAMLTRQFMEESFDTTQLLRVLTALRKDDFPMRSIRGIRRFSHLFIEAVTAKAMPDDKDYRTPWRNSLGGVDLGRRLNFYFILLGSVT